MTHVFKNSDYISSLLDKEVIRRYDEKINMCTIDPYTILASECARDFTQLPSIDVVEIQYYLVHGTSFYTAEEFCAYKSLGAYKHFLNGWVDDMVMFPVPNQEKTLLLGHVKHSLRLNEDPLSVWVLSENVGQIITAHCTCLAGLGEVCSHVAAILFMVDYLNKSAESKSVTDVKGKWPVPSWKHLQPSTLEDIIAIRKARSECKCESPIQSKSTESTESPITRPIITVDGFMRLMDAAKISSVLAKIVPPFCEKFSTMIEGSCDDDNEETARNMEHSLDTYVMSSYFQNELIDKSLEELVDIGKSLNLSISKETVDNIEHVTRQDLSKKIRLKWHKFRCGRVTGSSFKMVCCGKANKPCKTTLRKVCYPKDMLKIPPPIAYGKKNEQNAFNYFLEFSEELHVDFCLINCGLYVSQDFPIFASTPDGIATCSCCGKGCVEFKCPYRLRDIGTIADLIGDYLQINGTSGEYELIKTHEYYYQCQLEMHCVKTDFCFFVIWTPREDDRKVIKVLFDQKFWDAKRKIAETFVYEAVYPEILSKYFSRKMKNFE